MPPCRALDARPCVCYNMTMIDEADLITIDGDVLTTLANQTPIQAGRRSKVWKLWLKGNTYREIMDITGSNQATIAMDLKLVRAELKKSFDVDIEDATNEILAQTAQLKRIAYARLNSDERKSDKYLNALITLIQFEAKIRGVASGKHLPSAGDVNRFTKAYRFRDMLPDPTSLPLDQPLPDDVVEGDYSFIEEEGEQATG